MAIADCRIWTGTAWESIKGSPGPAGPSAVSADAGQLAKLGTDNLVLVSSSDLDLRYVNVNGDTMTGGLTAPSVTVTGDTIRVMQQRSIKSSTDPGNTGEICWDGAYIYVCVAPNTWRRAEILNFTPGPIDPPDPPPSSNKWTAVCDVPGVDQMGLLAFGDGKFVCSRAYSPDGKAWMATGVERDYGDVAYVQGWGFLRIANLGQSDWAYYLGTQSEWFRLNVTRGDYPDFDWYGAAFNGTTWVLSLGHRYDGRRVMVTTQDIVNGPLTPVTSYPNFAGGMIDGGGIMGRVFFGNGRFVAVNNPTGDLFWSDDGFVWYRCDGAGAPLPPFPANTHAAYLGGKWVLVTEAMIFVSTNFGSSWRQVASTFGKNWAQVAHNGLTGDKSKYVAVSYSGDVAYSKDAETWEIGNTGLQSVTRLRGVAFGAGRFVALGETCAYWMDGGGDIDPTPTKPKWVEFCSIPGSSPLGLLASGSGGFRCSRAGSWDGTGWTESGPEYGGTSVYYSPTVGYIRWGEGDYALAERLYQYDPLSGQWKILVALSLAYNDWYYWGIAFNGRKWVVSMSQLHTGRSMLIAADDITKGPFDETMFYPDYESGVIDGGGITWRVFAGGGAVGEGVFVAVHNPTGELFFSLAGYQWERCSGVDAPLGLFAPDTHAAFLGGKWVAVTDGAIYISTNGAVAWRQVAATPDKRWAQVAHNGLSGDASLYVAVAFNGWVGYSKDAVTWTFADTDIPKQAGLCGVAFGDHGTTRRFLAIGERCSYYLEDGQVTIPVDPDPPPVPGCNPITAAGGELIASGSTLGNTFFVAARSRAPALPGPGEWSSMTGVPGDGDVYYTGGRFIRLTQEYLFYSVDGNSWAPLQNLQDQLYLVPNWCGIASNGSKWVVTVNTQMGAFLYTATDIVNGPFVAAPPGNLPGDGNQSLRARVFGGNGTFVMVDGTSGTVYYSSDGENWSPATGALVYTSNAAFVAYAAYMGNQWVLCAGPFIWTSPTGAEWTARSLPNTYEWSQIAYSETANLYVAVPRNGRAIATSRDGATWTIKENFLPQVGDYGVASRHFYFVAVSKNCVYAWNTEAWEP